MTPNPPQNIGASVRARLTLRARKRKENVQLVLTHYAIERLLYRLSLSDYSRQFVLKGAMLVKLWTPAPYRATADLDLLGFGDDAPERICAVFRDICVLEVPNDGVIFKPETLELVITRIEVEYGGIRLTMIAEVAGARLPVRIDIGFGDVVTPSVREIEYPSMLDMPAPRLRAYPPETVIAEKFQALVFLGMSNSRIKDMFDLWTISETFSFDGNIIADAIRATFDRRHTAIPTVKPIALTVAFSQDATKQAQWRGFLRRTAITTPPGSFAELQSKVAAFVLPPTEALAAGNAFDRKWEAGNRWR